MLGLAKLAEVFEDLEQRFLRDLFGVLRLAAHEPTVVEYLGPEMADESLEGFGLAGDESARELGLGWLVHATIVTCFVAPGPALPALDPRHQAGVLR
jgi:hypothetical protein